MFHSKIEIYFRKARWQRFFLLSALLPALAALSSCGSSSTTATPTITLTSDATSGSVNVNGTVQFTATITNLSSTLANFEVSLTGGTPVIGGNATIGFITSGGKYTAPPTIPLVNNVQSNSVVITAAAQAQTSLTATYTLTLLPPATINGIFPQGATVAAGMTQPFTATFSSGTANGVNWFINNSPSCSATSALMGTTTSGSATVALTTGTASATIVGMQISGGGIPAGDSIASVTPTTITLVSPATASNTAETITLLGYANGLVPGNGTNTYPYGKMTLQGNYTAPVIPPAGGTIALTAVSQADPAQTKCVMLTLTYGNASLSGPYAFSTNGRVISTSAFFARAGSFTAGNGAVSGGIETYNEVGHGGATQHTFLGTYNIGPDGRGTMEFCEDTAASSCAAAAATAFFHVVIISAQQVQIMEFSPPGSSVAPRSASGEMILQDSSIVTAGNPAMTGGYSFDFSGILTGSTPLSMVGEFNADGRTPGAIATSVIYPLPGIIDINNGGSLSHAQISGTSSYSINRNGQGTAAVATNDPTFPNLAFNIYVVSASRAIFIESDGVAVMVGDAFKQQTNTCTWGTNSLNGTTILQTSGRSASGSVTDLISFTANGTGTAAAGSNDENNAGTVSSGTSLGGTYSIDNTAGSCGRGTLSLGSPASHTYVFYMISSSSAVIEETSTGVVGHGILRRPQTGSVTFGALNSFALNLAGSNAAGASAGCEDVLGQMNVGSTGSLVADQAGSFGSLDINNPDGLGTTQTIALTSGSLGAGSRTTLALTSTGVTRHYVLYLLSPTHLFVMSTDSTGVAQGSLYQQF